MNRDARRIVVLGGGFGGVYASLGLEKHFLRDDTVEIVLISEENFLLFTPMLPEVASGSIEAKHIISPVRAFFRKVQFHHLAGGQAAPRADARRMDRDAGHAFDGGTGRPALGARSYCL